MDVTTTPLDPVFPPELLVPDEPLAPPDGFDLVVSSITDGLPHTIGLGEGITAILRVPTGSGSRWRDADADAIVATSERETTAMTDEVRDALVRPPAARLFLRTETEALGVAPLVAGLVTSLPDDGDTRAEVRVEIVPLSWEIRAGSMRASGDIGSRLTLAWRLVGAATSRFSTPPVNPILLRRLPVTLRTKSSLGLAARWQIAGVATFTLGEAT